MTVLPSLWNRIRSSVRSPLGRWLVFGTFWATTGVVGSRVLLLLTSFPVARILGREVVGEYGTIQTTVGAFGIFAGMDLGLTATKYVAQYRSLDPAKAGRVLSMAGLLCLITSLTAALALSILSPWLTSKTLNAPHLANPLRIGCLLMIFTAQNGVQLGALQGLEAFRRLGVLMLIAALCGLPIVVTGAWLGGLPGVLWGQVIVAALTWLGFHWTLRRTLRQLSIPLDFTQCFREWREAVAFTMPAFFATIVVAPVAWLANAIVVNQPNGYAEYGLLKVAHEWRMVMLYVPGTLAAVFIPILTHLHAGENQRDYLRVFAINSSFVTALAVLAAAVVAIGSPWIMAGYGAQFVAGWPVLAVMVAAGAFGAVASVCGQVMTSRGKMWWSFSLNATWAAVLLSLAWSWRADGAIAQSWAYLLAYAISASLYLSSVWWILKHSTTGSAESSAAKATASETTDDTAAVTESLMNDPA